MDYGYLIIYMDNYEDIINLPHPVSTRHLQMSMMQRAAQFAPFAALTGYEAAINEAARKNDESEVFDTKYIMDEYDK